MLLGRQFTVQRNEDAALVQARRTQGIDRGVDLTHARHKDQHIARRTGVDNPFHRIRGLLGGGSLIQIVRVVNLHRKHRPLRDQNRTARAPVAATFRLRLRLGLKPWVWSPAFRRLQRDAD